MKRLLSLLCIAGLLCAIPGCREGGNDITPAAAEQAGEPAQPAQPKDTPSRVAERQHKVRLISMSFEEVVADADLIVDLTITEWLGESQSSDSVATYFSAKINRTFKGKERENIVLMQWGNSQASIHGYPLFKNGDRMILCLNDMSLVDEKEVNQFDDDSKKTWLGAFDFGSETPFKVVGMKQSELLVWNYDARDIIITNAALEEMKDLEHWNNLEELLPEGSKAKVTDYQTRTALGESLAKYAPELFEAYQNSLAFIYDYDDVVTLIEGILKGVKPQ